VTNDWSQDEIGGLRIGDGRNKNGSANLIYLFVFFVISNRCEGKQLEKE
jgi:hypothetical protein